MKTNSISISAGHDTDFGIGAKDVSIEVRLRHKANGLVTDPTTGRKYITGWAWTAGHKVTFHVLNPISESAALKAVDRALHQYAVETYKLHLDTEREITHLVTGVAIGADVMSKNIVDRKPTKNTQVLIDVIDQVKRAWSEKVAEIHTQLLTA